VRVSHVKHHKWMSHGTYEWVMSHMSASCHAWIQDGCAWSSVSTYEWVMARMNDSRHIRMSHVTHEYVLSRITGCVLREAVSLRTNESHHIWMSRVTYEWVKSHMITGWSLREAMPQCAAVRARLWELHAISQRLATALVLHKRGIITVFHKFVVLNKSYTWYLNASLQL